MLSISRTRYNTVDRTFCDAINTGMEIEEVLKRFTDTVMSLSGVVGTGQGLHGGESIIKVFVMKKTPELEGTIPTEFEGYKVVIEETGEARAYPER